LDEEKLKQASLAQHNGFCPSVLHSLSRVVKGTTKPHTYQKKECDKYDLIGPGGLLLVVSRLFAVLVLVFWVGLGKEKTKLGCEIFSQDHILSTTGAALSTYVFCKQVCITILKNTYIVHEYSVKICKL
jgi:hypothetical protein